MNSWVQESYQIYAHVVNSSFDDWRSATRKSICKKFPATEIKKLNILSGKIQSAHTGKDDAFRIC